MSIDTRKLDPYVERCKCRYCDKPLRIGDYCRLAVTKLGEWSGECIPCAWRELDRRWKVEFTEYQNNALRTECDQTDSLGRIINSKVPSGMEGADMRLVPTRALNAALGLVGEAGELAEIIKKWIFHGKPLELSKIANELGDILWYVSMMADVFYFKMADIARANNVKLQVRYPEKFTPQLAENRDTDKEDREAMNALINPHQSHQWKHVEGRLTYCTLCGAPKGSPLGAQVCPGPHLASTRGSHGEILTGDEIERDPR